MTKRVLAALSRQPVDRPPVSFWRHVPDVDHTAPGLAEAMPAFQRRSDLDFVKVMGASAVELEAVRLIARGRADDAPILHTLFSPLMLARKLAGDRLVEDLRQEPAAVEPALDAITEMMARHARAALDAGADGDLREQPRTPTCSGSAGRCRTATSSTTWCHRRAAASTTRTTR